MSQMCNGRVKIQILKWLESVHSHLVISGATGDTRISEDEDELLQHKLLTMHPELRLVIFLTILIFAS